MSEQETIQRPQQQLYSSLPQDYYSPLFNPQMYHEDRVKLAKELDPQNALIEILWTLRGKLKNTLTGKYDIDFQRVMNEKGIAVFITQVKAGANSINTYSNYRADDKLIYRMINKWVLDLVYIFYYNRKKFIVHMEKGKEENCMIEDEAMASIIINLAVGLMLPSFFKALGAGDRGAITRTVSEMINKAIRDGSLSDDVQGRKGLLSRLNPFSRR